MFNAIVRMTTQWINKAKQICRTEEHIYLSQASSMEHYLWYLQTDPELLNLQFESEPCIGR
jgi:hypothetical protein